MPKGGGSKTPQLDHFPLNTDMVEKQGGKKVRLTNTLTTAHNHKLITVYLKNLYLFFLKTVTELKFSITTTGLRQLTNFQISVNC